MSEPDEAGAGGGKGRPTPKRKDARKQRRVPLDRKEAARVRRERTRELRLQQRAALQSGDERHLPARDAGPAKRLARDVVDRRFTFGQVLYGLIIFVFLGTFLTQPASVPKGHKQPANVAGAALTAISILILIVVFIDAVRVGRQARREVTEKYGVKEAFGVTGYATIRALQPRRFRRPPPRVTRGGNPIPPKKT